MADPVGPNQVERRDISYLLDVEQLDLNLYRSKNLTLPFQARGVFGGQVISQALVVATKCVESEFTLHSLHAYFTFTASASVPLVYYVDRLRDGRSYSTRSVRAVQGGRIIFVMLCSFQVPDFSQPSRHWAMPQAPPPDNCEGEVEHAIRIAAQPETTEEHRSRLVAFIKSREGALVTVRCAGDFVNDFEGRWTFMYWMKAKITKQYSAAFQKCILGYISDVNFLPVAANSSRLKQSLSDGPSALGMMSSLDHSVTFYQNEFDCGDWLLYVMTSPAAGLGRGFCTGLLYAQDGTLLAVVNQEGVVRAKVRPPGEASPQAKAKM